MDEIIALNDPLKKDPFPYFPTSAFDFIGKRNNIYLAALIFSAKICCKCISYISQKKLDYLKIDLKCIKLSILS